MAELGFDVGPPPELPSELIQKIEGVEAQITTTVDVSSVADRKREALRAHASQMAESWFASMPDPRSTASSSAWRRSSGPPIETGSALPETDLFAGLR